MCLKNRLVHCVLAIVMAALFTRCGGSDAGGLTLNGLEAIPKLTGLVSANESATQAAQVRNLRLAMDLQMSGTPPSILELSQSDELVDSVYFGGLVAIINDQQSATSDQAQEFWNGQSACWLGQSVAESLGRVLEQGTSLCYMKEVPKAEGAATLVSGTLDDVKNIFAQQAADRLVKVTVTGEEQREGYEGSEDIFIKVAGSGSVGNDIYKVTLYSCNAGVARGEEVIEVNRSTGIYTSVGSHSGPWGRGQEAITASLKVNAEGEIVFDASQARSMTSAFSGTWGDFKGQLSISADNVMRARRYNSFSYGGNSGIDKNYSVASFTGDSLATLRFTQGASAGLSTWHGEGHSYFHGTEYEATRYVRLDSGAQYDEVNTFDYNEDAFFNEALTVAEPVVAFDCLATPDIAVEVNMAAPAMQEIRQICERERLENYNMCNGDAIQEAQSLIFQSQTYQH